MFRAPAGSAGMTRGTAPPKNDSCGWVGSLASLPVEPVAGLLGAPYRRFRSMRRGGDSAYEKHDDGWSHVEPQGPN